MSTATVVSFGMSLPCELKTGTKPIGGSTVTLKAQSESRDGTNSTQNQDWKTMSEISGQKETGATAGVDLVLPWPPSMNTYWRNLNGRTIISAKGREYRLQVIKAVAAQKADKHLNRPLRVTIAAYRPDKRRRDLDNLLKALLDSMTHAGVMEDDSLIIDLRIYWATSAKKGFVWVEIL
jgi:crossover junction endodeoxyribonuclease RusA